MQISELLARMEGVGAEGLGSATFFFFLMMLQGYFYCLFRIQRLVMILTIMTMIHFPVMIPQMRTSE